MGRESIRTSINPEVLKWARETAGWTIEEISQKLGVKQVTYQKIESGEKQPTLAVLKKLSNYYKRPLSAFFLPEPPKEPPFSTSFRLLPVDAKHISKDLRLEIRRARRQQSIANELMEELGLEIKPDVNIFSTEDDPQKIARKERKRLGIDIQQQLEWKNEYEAFRFWRNKLEDLNILAIQIKVPVEDARGFLLMDMDPPIIAVNSRDDVKARIFTLFHEYAHILLGISELYVPDELTGEIPLNSQALKIEKWCNNFAGEFLAPSEELMKGSDFQNLVKSVPLLSDKSLAKVSRKFKISKHAILLKMLYLDFIPETTYKHKLSELRKREVKEGEGFGVPPPKKCLDDKGRLFVSLVMEGKQKNLVSYKDVSDYLSIKLKHLDELSESV